MRRREFIIAISAELTAKRLEILRELVPNVTRIGVLTNRNNPNAESQMNDVAAAARAIQQEIYVVNASSDHDMDEALATLVQHRAGALLVIADAMFTNRRERLTALAIRHAVPAIYHFREFPAVGGLISYGASLADEWRRTGVYAGRILKGAKPADLPVLQPAKFELVINLKTAKAIGLAIPPSLLARADEVIE
jgi:putative tryptophan/tyrosine transport system substrate-binding protein